MDVRARKMTTYNPPAPTPNTRVEKMEYNRSLSQGSSRRLLSASHFSLVSLLLLICLTASLLILPLVLPPLPPPPFMLLLLPIGILALLMFLAFMPSNARDITYTYFSGNHILRAQKDLFISKADAAIVAINQLL
ncbi:hypothetical protein OIU78_027955 [Salix suchowensis]|nr:hypothetical protein OIU78_027955 [Salix suchowensis]